MARKFLKQPQRFGEESKSSKFVDWALGKTAEERTGRAIGAATLVAPGGATVGLARREIAKAIARKKAAAIAKKRAAEEAKRIAAILAKKRRQASLTRAAQRRTKAANDPKYAKPKQPEVDEGAIEQTIRALKDKAARRDAKGLLERAQRKAKKPADFLDAFQEKRLVKEGAITKSEWKDALGGWKGESTFKKGGPVKSSRKKPYSIDGIARRGPTRAKDRKIY
tara:strand:+ start:570 stop:1241 length:672 start_codon:yes stop_codon:yes gene_type:complete